MITSGPGPEFIKLEYSLRLKIKRNDWLLADICPQAANVRKQPIIAFSVRKQPIIALYFEFENGDFLLQVIGEFDTAIGVFAAGNKPVPSASTLAHGR